MPQICWEKVSIESGILGNIIIEYFFPDLVNRTKEGDAIVIKPNVQLPHVIELTYYGNGLAPYFVLQSIVVTALHIFSQKEVSKR